jgi:F-type H+-transporting ATPase subunit c
MPTPEATAMSDAVRVAGALVGGGIALGLGALGAALGDGMAGSQTIAAIARQPEIESKARSTFFLTVGCRSGGDIPTRTSLNP